MEERFSEENAEKAHVMILTGFLGSGKTTLLRRIISWETDLSSTVILVNEFGDIGIDGMLLKDAGSDIIELTSGCICCTLSNDLRQTLSRIWDQFKPRRILIETSGVSDPKSIAAVLNESRFQRCMALKKIITVLDADYWGARDAFGPLFFNQLEMGNLILLNKIDLLEKDQIPLFLKEIHETFPGSQVIPTLHCAIDPETLWMEPKPKSVHIKPIRFFQATSLKSIPSPETTCEDTHEDSKEHDHEVAAAATNFVTFSFVNAKALDETCFRRFLGNLPWEVFRVKGLVQFPDRTLMLNFVGGKSEWSLWDGQPETRLAFIGWGIDGKSTIRDLKECVSET
jgi:G3E family GTPase